MVDLKALSADRLERMAAAGRRVKDCVRVLGKTDDTLVGEVTRGHDEFKAWEHYPSGDVYDPETHGQYYYHAHAAGERGDEHGHFHTFLRALGMPPGMRPDIAPDYRPPAGPNDAVSHLVAISMDRDSVPVRLFTTNRWVTGEVWYAADDVISMLDRFDMDLAYPSWPVNVWVTSMVVLFRPQIVDLLRARDRAIAAWAAAHPGDNVYEDHGIEVASAIDISVDAQVEAIDAALEARAA